MSLLLWWNQPTGGGGGSDSNLTVQSALAAFAQDAALDSVSQLASLSALAGIAQSADVDATARLTAVSALAGIAQSSTLNATTRATAQSALAGIAQDAALDSVTQAAAQSALAGIGQTSTLNAYSQLSGTSALSPVIQDAEVGDGTPAEEHNLTGLTALSPFNQDASLLAHGATAESALSAFANQGTLQSNSLLLTNSALAPFTQAAELDVEGEGTPEEPLPEAVYGPWGGGQGFRPREGRASILEAEEEVNARAESTLAGFDSEAELVTTQAVVSRRPVATPAQEARHTSTTEQGSTTAPSGPPPSVAQQIEDLLSSLPRTLPDAGPSYASREGDRISQAIADHERRVADDEDAIAALLSEDW